MFRQFVTAAAIAAGIAAAAPATAAVLYDSGEPTICGCTLVGENQWLAGYLEFDAATTITGYEGFITAQHAGEMAFTIYDASGANGTPGAAVFSQDASIAVGPGAWIGISGLSLDLAAGAYFFGFTVAEDSDFQGYMLTATPNPTRVAFYDAPGSSWEESGNRGIGLRVHGETAGAATPGGPWPPAQGVVPEPATWAMMIMGFGAAGSVLRRRRHVAA